MRLKKKPSQFYFESTETWKGKGQGSKRPEKTVLNQDQRRHTLERHCPQLGTANRTFWVGEHFGFVFMCTCVCRYTGVHR